MSFANIRMLWFSALLLPLAAWFLWWSWRRKQELMRLFVSDRLLKGLLDSFSPERQRTKAILWLLGLAFLLLALSRPQWGYVWEETTQRGRDIIVAIDTSRSMLAEDMAPDRLTRAKLAALDLLRLAKTDRLGLIAFAGGAFLQCPLTMDDEVFRQNVNALNVGIIPQGGTAIGEAIDVALETFSNEEGDNHRVMVIFTDGEDHDSDVLKQAAKAKERNLKIFTVGVGTPAGQILKVVDDQGRATFIKDDAGNVVQSKLNEDLLRKAATEGGGFYLALRDADAMKVLFARGIQPLQAGDISNKMMRRLNERFYWPLSIAVLLLLIEAMLPSAPKRRVAMAILLFALAGPSEASPASAYRRFKEGRFKDARSEYNRLLEKSPNDPRLNYNAAAAAYQAGEYDSAAKGFTAAAAAPDLNLQESAYYNLGNTNYRLGERAEDPKVQEALWQQALKNYDAALKLDAQDKDAAFNQQIVKRRLEELKKQQQQQQQESNDDKKDNKDQEKKDQQDQKQDNKDQNKQDQKDQQQQQDNKKEDQKEQQQKDQEKQGDEKEQQQQQGEDQEGSQNQDGRSESDQNEDRERAEKEAKAAAMGQMTEKQAERLLDAQKNSEQAMIFQQSREKAKGVRVLKDW